MCVVYSNRAQCQIKLKKYECAFQDASLALSHDPNHMKSINRHGTAAYYTNRLRIARKDFNHSLSIEFSTQIAEYLIKVNKGIEKVKFEAYEKLKRQVLYSSGVDFTKGESQDEARKHGAMLFKDQAVKIKVKEMNLDEKILQEQAKKEEAVKKQQEEAAKKQEETKAKKSLDPEPTEAAQPDKKKKKKKNKKNKGLADFMEDDKEA